MHPAEETPFRTACVAPLGREGKGMKKTGSATDPFWCLKNSAVTKSGNKIR